MSPSYLIFQTLLPLFWTLTCMIWIELTRTDAVFSRIAMVLFLCRNKSSRNDLKLHGEYFWNKEKILAKESRPRGPHPVHEGGGAPHVSWPPWSSTDLNSNSIYSRSGRKNQGERFIAFYDTELPPSPNLSREADLESARGSGEGNPSPSSSSTFLHHQFHDAHRCA